MSALTDALEVRRQKADENNPQARLRIITVRVERETHERLKALAKDQRVSLNGLCCATFEAALKDQEVKAADQPASEQSPTAQAV